MNSFVIGLSLVASALVVFLVGREVICWYWKLNHIIALLESIDSKLTHAVAPTVVKPDEDKPESSDKQ